MVNIAKWAFLDSPTPIAFAHRGVHLDAGENTYASFAAARDLGYMYVETDARSTADGKLVAFHDVNIERLLGVKGNVSELTFEELQRRSAGSGSDLALIEDILVDFASLRFNIDLKDEVAAANMGHVLRRTMSHDRVCITSFSTRRIRRFKKAIDRDVCTGAGVADVLCFSLRWSSGFDWAVLQLPMWLRGIRVVTPNLVARAHAAGVAVHVWTLNDLASIRRALDFGVDGIMTDEPVLLKQELAAHALWYG